jgi:hypothetical protein
MWMRLWGGSSPKRTLLVSNGKAVKLLCTGKLDHKLNPTEVQTTTKYRDGKGKLRYHGTKALKSTQPLASESG